MSKTNNRTVYPRDRFDAHTHTHTHSCTCAKGRAIYMHTLRIALETRNEPFSSGTWQKCRISVHVHLSNAIQVLAYLDVCVIVAVAVAFLLLVCC